MLNGQGVGNGIPNTNTVTLPAGTNTFNGEVQYEFTCEDGSLGYSTDPFSAISSKVAYVDDETAPTITPPNANPNYGLPDKTGDIYFTSTSDTLFMYDHYFSGTFTQIKGSDTFKVGSGQNSAGHTNCGQTGATLSFPGASSTVSLSVGMSGSRAGVGVSATAAVGVSVGSTGTSAGPIGENHKMVSWQIYDRETQITSMVKGANSYHKVINTTASITSNEGTINVATNLPTTKSVTGHAAATGALPCCPNTL